MVITLDSELESALSDLARKGGVTPEVLALNALRERFLNRGIRIEPRDEWERRVLALGTPCGPSLSDEALSSEGLYD